MAESVTVPLPREALQRLRRGAGAAGTSSSCESKRLAMLGEEARRLTLKKAHGYRLLKWRGVPIPSHRQVEPTRTCNSGDSGIGGTNSTLIFHLIFHFISPATRQLDEIR